MTTEVLPEHIDALGHVNNVQYLYWVSYSVALTDS